MIGGKAMGMSTKEIDARGLVCPQPVVFTKQALDAMDIGTIVTIVDNEVAKENIVKFAKNRDDRVNVKEQAGNYYIEIQKGASTYTEASVRKPLALARDYDTVIVITRNVLGDGPEELGAVLIKSFLYSLVSSDHPPMALILLNSGVKLAVTNSAVLDHIRSLEEKGTKIFACGTCLDYYNLKEMLAVGSVTNMYSVIEWMNCAGKVITI
jgi:selenium metabolism protein YedF